MRRRDTGNRGENLACGYLRKRGYHILETNYRCRRGEIDIVARHNEYLVFIEVRTKKGDSYGSPEESITRAKKERLKIIALHYQQEHKCDEIPLRIDFIAVELDEKGRAKRIEIIDNAVA